MGLLEIIILIVLVLWLAGWGLHFGGSLIHLLLIIVIIVVIIRLLRGRDAL